MASAEGVARVRATLDLGSKPQTKPLTAETAEGRRDTQEKQRRGLDFSPAKPSCSFVSFVVHGICAGKQDHIHLTVGTADTFHLDEPARLLDQTLQDLGIRAQFTYIEGRTHFDL